MAKDKKPKAKPSSSGQPPTPTPTASQPAWPPFKPSLPVVTLAPEPLLDARVVLLRNVFPASLCRAYVAFLRTLPLATTTPPTPSGRPRRGDAVRVNDRFQVHDPAFAERLWAGTGLREALVEGDGAGADAWRGLWGGHVVGLSPNIRVYRYSAGQFFAAHYDESNNVTIDTPQGPVAAKTTWTLLLYLTSAADGCLGGETVFHPRDRRVARDEVAVAPETGMVLLHDHLDCMLHEGREVTAGEKWVIRSDICVRK